MASLDQFKVTVGLAATIVVLQSLLLLELLVSKQPAALRFSTFVAFLAAGFSLLAAIMFVTSLNQFKTELRKAYVTLSIGLSLFGLAQLQLPVVAIHNLKFWINSGAIAILYLVGGIGILLGTRKLASLLNVNSRSMSLGLMLAISTFISVPASMLPHAGNIVSEPARIASLVITILCTVLISFAAHLTYRVRQVIGPEFVLAIRQLFHAWLILGAGGAHWLVVQLVVGEGHWYREYSITFIPFALGALMLIRASYTFNKIGGKVTTSHKTVITPLDIVEYTASMASNPAEIDVILDDVRLITSRLQPGEQLSANDEKKLKEVYLRLEEYLTTREALRVFTKEKLRRDIAVKFSLDYNETTFWPKLS